MSLHISWHKKEKCNQQSSTQRHQATGEERVNGALWKKGRKVMEKRVVNCDDEWEIVIISWTINGITRLYGLDCGQVVSFKKDIVSSTELSGGNLVKPKKRSSCNKQDHQGKKEMNGFDRNLRLVRPRFRLFNHVRSLDYYDLN